MPADMLRSASAIVAASALVTGCFSTSHTPRDRRKVYHTMESGVRGYSRNGEFFSEMGFGGGLVDAVAGNPRASEEAETFRDRMIMGFLGTMGGAVCLPSLLIYEASKSYNSDYETPASHGYLAIGCLVLMTVGAISLASAFPHQLDAINIYNDDIDAQPQFAPPAYGPPMQPQPMQPQPMQPPPMQPQPPPQPMGPGGYPQ